SQERQADLTVGYFMSVTRVDFSAMDRRVLPRLLTRLLRDDQASIAIKFAMTLSVMLAVAGGTIDYAAISVQKQRLQWATDAAALAGAKELSIPGLPETLDGRVMAMVQSSFDSFVAKSGGQVAVSLDTVTDRDAGRVRVTATQAAVRFFSPSFGVSTPSVSGTATAAVVGKLNLCLIGLNESEPGVIGLVANSTVIAKGCAVYSNSTSSNGLYSMDNAKITADLICTAGGMTGGNGNYSPQPVTDCPRLADPLIDRLAPSYSGCTATKLTIKDNQSVTLFPGVYCGGITIKDNAVVTFLPGIYTIKDGPFLVLDNASMVGEYVGFHLVGLMSSFNFAQNSTIELSAPKTGQLAGMLFFEDRDKPTIGIHTITSAKARTLVGTIYLWNSTFLVDAESPVADKSAYTAIIAKRVIMKSGPALVLNTDYGATDVPVPEGVGSLTGKVALVQ
ncbi:MAG: pilus assembly protein TadG-related protein, partial [Hyphomicrobium sp.]